MCMRSLMKGSVKKDEITGSKEKPYVRQGQVGICKYMMRSPFLSLAHTEENGLSSGPRATAKAPVLL